MKIHNGVKRCKGCGSTVSGLRSLAIICLLLCGVLSASQVCGQKQVIVNLAAVDGVDLTPDNILNFQVQSQAALPVKIRGSLHYRNSDLRFSYSFSTRLHPGLNSFSTDLVHPQWEFSSGALRELFFNYKRLPQGTYEYCVEVIADHSAGEIPDNGLSQDCLYRQSEDLFMISLLEPENDAKIYEYYPMLSWVVNYPFAGELTYRVRVAEIKQGQNTQNAIVRNNPMYDERNLMQPSIVYPVYAKALEVGQPYAWTVDAYYKGILLGGAEPWKFTIVEDSLLKAIPTDPSYVELNIEQGNTVLYAVGQLKLKYLENEQRTNTLHFSLTDDAGKLIKLPESDWLITRGDNRKVLSFHEVINLKHLKTYRLTITTENGHSYKVLFKYVNPLYLR